VGSAYGDAVSLSQRLFGGQGVAPLKDPALDGSTEIGGNLSVRTVVIRWPSECPRDSSLPGCTPRAGRTGMRPLTVRAAR